MMDKAMMTTIFTVFVAPSSENGTPFMGSFWGCFFEGWGFGGCGCEEKRVGERWYCRVEMCLGEVEIWYCGGEWMVWCVIR